MKRWFYILLGGIGVGMALGSLFLIWQAQFIWPAYQTLATILEYVLIPVGLGLGWMGLIYGRQAGEFDIAAYVKSSRSRQPAAGGQAIYLPGLQGSF